MTIKEALDIIARDLQVEQKSLINRGGKLQAYKSGELHKSITVDVRPFGDFGLEAYSSLIYYGVYVNNGTKNENETVRMAPRPFIDRSIQNVLANGGTDLLVDAGVDEATTMVDKELKPITIKS